MNTPSRILIVEDEPLIGMMMQDFLEILGVEHVVLAEDVARALTAIDACQFDAAILDVNLGRGARSDAVAERLASLGVPFAAASGDPSPPAGWGVRPMLSKPFTLSDVERMLAVLAAAGSPRVVSAEASAVLAR